MTFIVKKHHKPLDNPFDRQELITWWDQEKIRNVRVMVVGAGAIGNETIKNLVLLGVGHIIIIDFDVIETSNLSRTVLFRGTDVGQKKAEIAAKRAFEMRLYDGVKIDWYHGDVVWELGSGAFRAVDLVLGCLDNIETRIAVNRQCWMTQTPWIDAGISHLASHVVVYTPSKGPCYQCHMATSRLEAARRRYSCDNFKKAQVEAGHVPTVQVASAFVSAIQVQEAVKLLCGQHIKSGIEIIFQGMINDFDIIKKQHDENCIAHVKLPEPSILSLSTNVTVGEFLKHITENGPSSQGAVLEVDGDRTFVTFAACRKCGEMVPLFQPNFRVYDHEIVCRKCRISDGHVSKKANMSETIDHFSLDGTSKDILNMTMRQIGFPIWPIVTVQEHTGIYRYYELRGDQGILFQA